MYHLTAAPSPILYHITNIDNAISILRNNYFSLSPSEAGGRDAEVGKSGRYFLSTARSTTSRYFRINDTSVIFVLDGTKLAQRYKADAVHYWATTDSKAHEMEDRIYSKQPKIPAIPYIKQVRITNTDEYAAYIYTLYKLCKFARIPVQVYEPEDLAIGRRPVPYKPTHALREPANRERMASRGSDIHGWLNLYRINLDGKRPSAVAKAYQYKAPAILMAYNHLARSDAKTQLEHAIHNALFKPHGNSTKTREALDKFIAILRKNKWSNIDYINAMIAKWYPKA